MRRPYKDIDCCTPGKEYKIEAVYLDAYGCPEQPTGPIQIIKSATILLYLSNTYVCCVLCSTDCRISCLAGGTSQQFSLILTSCVTLRGLRETDNSLKHGEGTGSDALSCS